MVSEAGSEAATHNTRDAMMAIPYVLFGTYVLTPAQFQRYLRSKQWTACPTDGQGGRAKEGFPEGPLKAFASPIITGGHRLMVLVPHGDACNALWAQCLQAALPTLELAHQLSREGLVRELMVGDVVWRRDDDGC